MKTASFYCKHLKSIIFKIFCGLFCAIKVIVSDVFELSNVKDGHTHTGNPVQSTKYLLKINSFIGVFYCRY